MKKSILVLLLLSACAGGDDRLEPPDEDEEGSASPEPMHADLFDPEHVPYEGTQRFDMSPKPSPEPEEDSEFGEARQAFTAAEYHGHGQDGFPCYVQQNGPACVFPSRKDFRVKVGSADCFADPMSIFDPYSSGVQIQDKGIQAWGIPTTPNL